MKTTRIELLIKEVLQCQGLLQLVKKLKLLWPMNSFIIISNTGFIPGRSETKQEDGKWYIPRILFTRFHSFHSQRKSKCVNNIWFDIGKSHGFVSFVFRHQPR